jgi:hypothetical protein
VLRVVIDAFETGGELLGGFSETEVPAAVEGEVAFDQPGEVGPSL